MFTAVDQSKPQGYEESLTLPPRTVTAADITRPRAHLLRVAGVVAHKFGGPANGFLAPGENRQREQGRLQLVVLATLIGAVILGGAVRSLANNSNTGAATVGKLFIVAAILFNMSELSFLCIGRGRSSRYVFLEKFHI